MAFDTLSSLSIFYGSLTAERVLCVCALRAPCASRCCPFTAAQESVSAYRQDWGSIQSEFIKRFDTQLKQELSDHGSSITGAASTVRQCLVANQCVRVCVAVCCSYGTPGPLRGSNKLEPQIGARVVHGSWLKVAVAAAALLDCPLHQPTVTFAPPPFGWFARVAVPQ